MSLYEHGPAIFYQRSKAVQDEFELIRIATLRDQALSRLADIIRDVKELRKELDDDVILETFRRINMARELTIQFVKYLSYWQGAFTQPVRPMLFEGDYLIHDFMKSTDFVNSSKIRKIFNFQFYRGNVLMLPYPNMKTIEPPKVHPDLYKELEIFANPKEEDVIACYQILINTLPDAVYREKLAPLEKWLIEPWEPTNVIVSDRTDEKFFTAKTDAAEPESETKRKSSNTNTRSGSNNNSRRGSIISCTSGKGNKKGDPSNANPKTLSATVPPPPAISPPGRLRKGVSQKSIKSEEKKNVPVVEVAPTVANPVEDVKVTPVVKVFEPKLTVEQKKEIADLEKYYEDLENQFLPKISKRAQSADTTALLPNEAKDEDIVFRGKKIFYSTTKVNTSEDNLELISPTKNKSSSPNKKNKKKEKKDTEKVAQGEGAKEENDDEGAEKEKEEDEEISDLDNDEDEDDDDDEDSKQEGSGEKKGEADEATKVTEKEEDGTPSKSEKPENKKKIKNPVNRNDSRRMSELTMNISEPANSRRSSLAPGAEPLDTTAKIGGAKAGANPKKLTLPNIDPKHKKKSKEATQSSANQSQVKNPADNDELSLDIDTSSMDDYNSDSSPYRRVKRKPKKLTISTQNMRAWFVIQQQNMAKAPGSAGHY